MSEELIVHFVCDNKIDTDIVEKKFNTMAADEVIGRGEGGIPTPIFNGAVMPRNNYITLSESSFKKITIGNEKNANKFWVSYAYGESMFLRKKYTLLDIETHMLASNSGETFYFGRPTDPALTPEEFAKYMEETAKLDPPPTDELKEWFDYILSENTHFYILFSIMPYEIEEMEEYPIFLRGNLIEGRRVVELDSKTAQDYFIKQFDIWFHTRDFGDSVYETIFKIS